MATIIFHYELMYQIARHPGLVFLCAKIFIAFLTHIRVWNLWRNKTWTCMLWNHCLSHYLEVFVIMLHLFKSLLVLAELINKYRHSLQMPCPNFLLKKSQLNYYLLYNAKKHQLQLLFIYNTRQGHLQLLFI